jgi:RNA polymerase sigma-70 factor, ECF subfamily
LNKLKKATRRHLKRFSGLIIHFYVIMPPSCLKRPSAAEEIVQELFVRLWEKREDTHIETSVKNYLFRAVKNHCLNYIRHSKIKDEYFRISSVGTNIFSEEDYDSQTELMQKIEESIASLPEKRREIFRLSRQEGLKYREIAAKLNVSIKTVETQMGFAIKSLREMLKDFLPIF